MAQTCVSIGYTLGRTMHIVRGYLPTWFIKSIKEDYGNVPHDERDTFLKQMTKKAQAQRRMQQRYIISQNAKRSMYEVDKHMEALLAHGLLSGCVWFQISDWDFTGFYYVGKIPDWADFAHCLFCKFRDYK